MSGFLRILILAPFALIGYTLLYLAVRTFIEYRPSVATGPIVIVGQLSSAWYWAPLMFGAIAAPASVLSKICFFVGHSGSFLYRG